MTVVIGDRDPSFVRMTRVDGAVRDGLALPNALRRASFPYGYLPIPARLSHIGQVLFVTAMTDHDEKM
jgi:hypothetical protein